MALIKPYSLPIGVEAPNAYHIVSKVHTWKIPKDIPDPGGVRPENAPDHIWKAGYYGIIVIGIYFDKTAREAGNIPIGARTPHTANVPPDFRGWPDLDEHLIFTIDLNSPLNEVEQAYNYIKTLPYYQGAQED